MVFNQDFAIKKTPNKWFWSAVFLISLGGLSFLGLNPVLIGDWWWLLASYNVLMSCVAIYYIVCAVSKLKKDNKNGVVGTQFTWSFVKIIPLLVIAPVLSFYLFSFQTIQDNVERSKHTYNNFNKVFLDQVDALYENVQIVRNDRYTDHTSILLKQIENYSNFQKDKEDYINIMQIFVQGLVDDQWACYIELTDEEDEIIAQSKKNNICIVEDNQPLADIQPFVLFEDEKTNLFQVQMSTRYLTRRPTKEYMNIVAVYATDPNLLSFLGQVKGFYNFANAIKFNVNTSLTQKSFLLDFSSTVLLTILSVLLIVFRMIDQLMRPMHNLSVASKEIAKGNYDVLVHNQEQSEDMRQLIGQFNEMAKQIKASRQGLDTHNLYLETILKYSYGVIGLDKDKKIQLINPVIVEMLGMDGKDSFVGKFCSEIVDKYTYLKPLFSMTSDKLKQDFGEWSEEVEISLPNRHLLLSCQGATLEVESEILGYVIIVKDISQLNRAQKKAAWGEVAMRMAHEIKIPLTPILLSAQRLRNIFLEKLKGKDLEVIDKTTNVIIDQVKSMDAMVSAFADYANMPLIERKLMDLNTLVNQSIDLYDAQDNITIDFDLSSDMPKLLLDTNNISRVLINLVKNAAESVEQKRDLNIKIATQYLPSQGMVRLTVEDNGDGFDAEVIDRVFEPYVTTKLKGRLGYGHCAQYY